MAPISIDCVVSVNSEDPAYPAENLLNATSSNKKWKCKMGETQASVVLQLKQPTVISGIDIGNAHSAFVEILVGRSSAANDNFQVLLVASSLMTLKEAKDGVNTNGVRFFKTTDLLKPTANEKWDRIKIVCTQPFNKHVQYGLSFIVLHGSESSDKENVSLGRFTLKNEEPKNNINVGSWFAKRKELEKTPLTGAAAIREASTPAGISLGKNKKMSPNFGQLLNGSKKPNNSRQILPMVQLDDEDDSDKDPDYKQESSATEDEDMFSPSFDDDNEKKMKKRKPNVPKTTNHNSTKPSTSTSKNPPTPKTATTVKRNADSSDSKETPKRKKKNLNPVLPKTHKPFSKLLEDVVIVISGYQNPLRGELRAKALSMGSKYKADWDNSCTHLICAFPNTPKFNQVRGQGKIVKREWVEDCYDRRRRLPWRRYALDRNDQGKAESEEEICEEVPVSSVSSIERGDRRRTVSGSSDSSDTEDEIERVKARQTKLNTSKQVQPKKLQQPVDPFNDDTDHGSNEEDTARICFSKLSQTAAALPLPPLLDLFDNIKFFISDVMDEEEILRLRRYIIGYKGSVTDTLSTEVKYFITDKQDLADKVKKNFRISAVKPDWIWESNDQQRLLPSVPFEW